MDVAEAWKIYIARRCLCHRDTLILVYRPLVRKVASKMRKVIPRHIEMDDLESYGMVGLIRSVERYDVDFGVTFETYASAGIRGAILDELRAQDWAPRSLRRKHRAVKAVQEDLERGLEREATAEEIGARLLIPASEVADIIRAAEVASHYSLDGEDTEGEGHNHYEHVLDAAAVSPDQEAEGGEMYARLLRMIALMTWQERALLALYYFRGATLAEIAQELGMPESRISLIHKRVVLLLRDTALDALEADPM